MTHQPTGSEFLGTGMTPAGWAAHLSARGLETNERSLREKANRIGACYRLGNAMILTPAHIDKILKEGQKCRLKHTSGCGSGGSVAVSMLNGRAITDPYCKSTGAADEAGAWDWIAEETELQCRKHCNGEKVIYYFRHGVAMYPAYTRAARQLLPLLDEIGDTLLSDITGRFLKSLGPKLCINASMGTWWREIVTPARAAINHAHQIVGTPLLRVTRYSQLELIDQDRKRNR